MALVLGSILFTDFEIPEQVPFGGEHMLVVRKLVGGDRVVDAMGRDDMDLAWSGRFRGGEAEARAASLDLMRVQGQEQVLTWSSRRYRVVVKSFKADFQQAFEIPYSITCTVLEDLSLPILAVDPTPDAAIGSDVNASVTLAGLINVPAITAAVGGVATSRSGIDSFQSAAAPQLSAMQSSLSVALGAVAAQTTAQNGIVTASGTVGGVVAGQPPQTIATALLSQNAAFGQLGSLYQLQALLGRTSINVVNAGS